MPPSPITNFEIRKYYQNELWMKFDGVYSRNNLPKIKDRVLEINLAESQPIGAHWIVLYVTGNNVTYFDSVGVKYIPKEIRKYIVNKNITTDIYRIRAYDSIMYGYSCIGFINFMLNDKRLFSEKIFLKKMK